MDLNERFNDALKEINSNFGKLQEDYNRALYNGVKYQDPGFLQTGIADFFNNLNNVLNGYTKAYNNIMKTHISMVKSLLANDLNKKIRNNTSIIVYRPIKHPFETSGFVYTIDVFKTMDMTVLQELLDLDKMLGSITSYSSGEIAQNYNFEFLPNFNRPTWIAKILGIDTSLSEKDFTKVAYVSMRNGSAQPIIFKVDNAMARQTLNEYDLNPKLIKDVEILWTEIYLVCERLQKIINTHKTRIDKICSNAIRLHHDKDESNLEVVDATDQLVIFMDRLKKASLVIDDILSVYSKVLKIACYALLAKIQQEQYILVSVIDDDRSKE